MIQNFSTENDQPWGNILAMNPTNSLQLTEQGKMLQWQGDAEKTLALGSARRVKVYEFVKK